MNKLNQNLDLNNPAHKIVYDINIKNEELYGPYHEECGLFQKFCRCKNLKENENEQSR